MFALSFDMENSHLESLWRQQFLNSGPILLQGLANGSEKEACERTVLG